MKQKIGFREELRTGVTHLWKENKFIIIVFLIGLSLLLAAVLSYARPLSDTGTIRVVNYAGPTLKLSDFKDKVLILDFWATYCAPCRALLPRYDSLQREMGAQLQILLVTHEPAGRAAAFLRQQGYILPSVTGDTLLAHAFPHNGIPFEVWINRGKIMAVTDGDEVSREQVENVLAGRSDRLARKVVTPFDEDKPLLVNGNGATEGGASVLYQSVMTPYNPGLNRIAGIHRAGGSINVFALNASPLSLYHLAFRGIDPMLDVSNRYLIEMPDSLDEEVGLGHTSGKAWLERFALCYNLVLPAAFKGDLGQFILDDLNRFFNGRYGLEARLEERSMDCLVLCRIPGTPSAAHRSHTEAYRSDSSGTLSMGLPLSQLVLQLAYTYRRLPTPIVDETGYSGPVDISLEGDIGDRRQLERALRSNGLQLISAKRPITMVVIHPILKP